MAGNSVKDMDEIKSNVSHGLMEKALKTKTKLEADSVGLLAKISKGSKNMNSKSKVIIVKDGIFSIEENLEVSNVIQDPELKKLVDSVIK